LHTIPIICIVSAVSGTGKTTFMEKLISEMTQRGYKVGAVKSDSHGFEMDIPGKDSWRFGQAGATVTAVVGPNQYAFIQKTDHKKELSTVTDLIEGVDIILAEGFKNSDHPKIEIVRQKRGASIVSDPTQLIAVVTDVMDIGASAPIFDINDYQGIADLIINTYNIKGG